MSNHVFDPDTGASYGNTGTYVLGFVLSIVLTLIAFGLFGYQAVFPSWPVLSKTDLYIAVGILAIIQLYVQAVFFLHLSLHSKARWNLLTFIFTLIVVLILVIGTLWIMYNLYVNMGMMTMAKV